ncbi:sugar transferase [Phenylobacterium soli]|uniref:sugar transferase n=1 Tax=Phenylobacterium soli TaxID=2170551 RepID=UPI0029C61F18|nr:sugar transferase [Phenylobacterium soli]
MSVLAEQIAGAGGADAANSRAKRLFDVVTATTLILLLLPTLLLIAAAIFLESGGPVLFRQVRGGLNGRLFTIYKFRTMRVDCGEGWTRRDDDRITPLGGFLRRTSLDELPQLLNVVLGDMSLVGPRPHAAAMDDEYRAQIATYDARLRTRPGITGLAQVSDLRGSIGALDEMHRRLAADVEYIDSWSLWLDVKILVRTVPHLLFSGNSY